MIYSTAVSDLQDGPCSALGESGKISRRAINWKNREGRAFNTEGTAFAKTCGLETVP